MAELGLAGVARTTPSSTHAFRNLQTDEIVLVVSSGCVTAAKALHVLRKTPSLWSEMPQVSLQDAVVQTAVHRVKMRTGGAMATPVPAAPSQLPIPNKLLPPTSKARDPCRYCKRTGCAGPSADETGMCRIGSAAWSKITALQQDLFRASDQINAVMKKWPRMGDMPSINARLSPLLRRIKDALDRAGTLGPVTPNVLGIGREILQSFAVLKQDVKTWMGSSAAVEASVGVLDEDLQTSQNVLVNGETLFSSIRSGKQCLVQILQEVWDLQEAQMKLSCGSEVNISDFDILKSISQGGSSKVYLSRKRGTDDLYAIKVMSKAEIRGMDMEKRVVQERQILSLLGSRNPYIARLYFAFRSSEYLFLVQEYVNGGDCQSLLKRTGQLSIPEARHFIAEAVLAIEFLHNNHIVHRDLKPDNLMITRDGHIKIIDFGLSRMLVSKGFGGSYDSNSTSLAGAEEEKQNLDESYDNSQLSFRPVCRDDKLYSPVGTSQYLAPEIVLGSGHDQKVDWWSLGVLLYEFLTGRTPFDADDIDTIYNSILGGEIEWPQDGSIPPDAQDLISRLLTCEASARLGSNGATEVKNHPFFKGIEWATLYLQPSPFMPPILGDEDTTFFPGAGTFFHGQFAGHGTNKVNDSVDFGAFSYVNMETVRYKKGGVGFLTENQSAFET